MRIPRCHCGPLIKAIDAYIRKADENLADALEEEGYVEPEETVRRMNRMEDAVAGALIAETNLFVSSLKDFQEHPADYIKHVEESLDLEIYAAYVWPDVKLTDELKPALISVFKEQFKAFMPHFIKRYIGRTDRGLSAVWSVVGPEGNGGRISKRTVAWIESWSEQLAEIMRLNSHTEIENILKKGLEEGVGIEEFTRRILESGIRNERYKARRVAVTEVLTAHRVAQQEAFMQSPSVTEKIWKHTGAYRNEPRENHVKMDGERVPKAETFRLIGADGHTYFPMIPGDTILPAGERINCHCTIQPLSDESILGMSLEERKKLQQQAIDEMDAAWEKELDARNKAKAGINEETVKLDWIHQKSHDEQIKYFGGGDAGEQRLALLDSGVITKDSELERLYKQNSKGVRVRKNLQELVKDGIVTVNRDALEHSTKGEYATPSKSHPNGRMKSGGHSQAAMDIMNQSGIQYRVVKTYSNGVRIGYVEGHRSPYKNGITEKMAYPNGKLGKKDADIGQSWFPDNWTEYDIRCAGTYAANKGKGAGDLKFADYRGVRTGVYLNSDGLPATIFPHNMAQPTADGGLEGARD